ncbi:Pyroglutamyl peptidase type i [Lasiodiplodia theobromae]|uniref:Pyroglutamyl peptidase type i n=1 Tax=Lasiodiplodia theobromae TaxID=45133 RepID=UPI0015C3CC40|nr:Pyroglutamyl peptidase type i [Lasiodiplodia theobromae]KAF4536987.1 Pyroglutamyl peptidase type i [Lasiodiplodia theobromae]
MGDIRASNADAARPDVPSAEPSEREVTVLVTGFGPFLDEFPINPSWEIARSLPSHLTLPPQPPIPSSSPSAPNTKPPSPTKIKIITPPAPLRVSYHPTATILPELLTTHAPDLVLHIGLAAGRDFFAIERSSARLGYARNDDVDGRRWTSAESDAAWPRYPERLETGLGFAGVWEGWRGGCCERVEGVVGDERVESEGARGRRGGGGGGERKGRRKVAIRPFDNVGSYLCGFSYYTSLAWFWARECEREAQGVLQQEGVERPVLFLHVPGCPEDEDVVQGTEITEELIKAMVACWVAQKERNEKQSQAIAA